MRRLFIFVNLLVIPLLSGWVVYRRLATPPADVVAVPRPFDYFKLALQWPPSLCGGYPRCPNNFTIHGLWPDNFTGHRPRNCNNQKYIRIRGMLLQQMKSNWPDLINHKDQFFWGSQWKEHGTCSLLPQVPYFNLTLNWTGQYDFLGHFHSHNITPGPSSHYPVSKINKTVISLTSKSPDLLCEHHIDEHAAQRLTLHEVRFCLDPKGNGVIDCPANRSSGSCSGDIYFPQ